MPIFQISRWVDIGNEHVAFSQPFEAKTRAEAVKMARDEGFLDTRRSINRHDLAKVDLPDIKKKKK